MKKRFIPLFIFIFANLWANQTLAEKKVYVATRVNPYPPIIDGHLDDPAWAAVDWKGEFIQREPYEGKEPSQETAFKILYDDKNVYVGIRAYDTEPAKIDQRMSRRDDLDGDIVGIQFDSYFDHRTAFTFIVNTGGVKCDGVFTNDGENEDFSPDPVWYVKTATDDQGWTAEMQIPLSQLRFGNQKDQIWGLQVARYLFRKEELSLWQFIAKDAPGWVHLFGELHGLRGIKTPRRIELLPYSVGRLQTFQKEEDNPFATGRLNSLAGGLDGKIGVTSDLTLDFTINPDFGQVEADPSEVNLTTFETFFEEKRPFFIEGKNILDFRLLMGDSPFSNDMLFYSRRIGRFPQYEPDVDDDEYVKMPTNTSIISALKLTGKTHNCLSIGIMEAVTAEEKAEIDFQRQRHREVVEPMTNYFLGRLQKDYNKGSTILGGMFTVTNRNISDPQLNFLNRSAYTGGIDFSHRWKDRTYLLDIKTAFSHVRGDKEAILETQTASSRYFQRPDANYVTLDSSRIHLSGHGGTFVFGKISHGHWQYILCSTWRSPGLELNDLGYLRMADIIMQFVWVGYRIWNPISVFRRININFNQWNGWNFGREGLFAGGNINVDAQFLNYWGFGTGINREGPSLSTNAQRGGPAMRFPGGWNNWFNIYSDERKSLQLNLMGSNSWNNDGISRSQQFRPGITWRPSNALQLSFNPSYSINRDNLQYVDTIEKEDYNRYIFARLDQKTLGIVFRLNYSLTPDLSIQYYGQPFVSSGEYSQFKKITRPRADGYDDRFHIFTDSEISPYEESYGIDEDQDGFDDYYIDKPDFNFREFRSNLVIRWEYTPGSTIFFVWSQGRTVEESIGDFSFRNDIQDLFDIYPHNVFLIKLNHWFSL
ncbi:carbohydrate binding family 9 domain-containing protein [candidate division KSB1 bacterium]|nr:carbohydrate binding family 9 domain-containing protein [candidate division KSB1 bacterium]